MRRQLLAVVVLSISLILATPSAGASDTTLPEAPEGVNSIIGPQPGQGVEPQESGDRGGAAQIAIFLLIIGGLGLMGTLVVRDMRKGKERRAAG
ncbi:MAG: hypothetical protein AAGA99_18505 [Actinomycetota bacterium]